jgi:hypothetical protein
MTQSVPTTAVPGPPPWPPQAPPMVPVPDIGLACQSHGPFERLKALGGQTERAAAGRVG